MLTATKPTPTPQFTQRLGDDRTVGGVALDYLLISLAHFALLPILPVLLTVEYGATAGELGVLLFVFTLTTRGGSILLAPLIDRVPARSAAVSGLIFTGLAFWLLGLSNSVLAAAPCLAIAGVGISVHGVVSRAIVARQVTESGAALRAFSLINVAVNIAAAVGPLLSALLSAGQLQTMLWAVGASYLVAALLVARVLRATAATSHAGPMGRSYLALFRLADFRTLSLANLAGWFLYGQLFSAIPLYLLSALSSRTAGALAFTLNGVMIAACQLPVSAAISRVLRRRPSAATFGLSVMAVGIGLFGTAFLLLAGAGGNLLLIYAAIGLFSVGEMLFVPTSDAAFSAVASNHGHDPVRVFNARKLTTSGGEALGALAGGSLSLLLSARLGPSAYWLGLGACALLAAVLSVRPRA
jgi:DHA1 family multidrug resistance protein-like MFS transporter